MVELPRINYIPGTELGVVNVELSKPQAINAGNPSVFPLETDVFKNLNYQTANKSRVKQEMSEYYTLLSKIMGGSTPVNSEDIRRLESLTTKIKDYVLTDDDYNLVVGALQNIQAYVVRFMYSDITSKARAMDEQLNLTINEIDRFMGELEKAYSKSPSEYPIPNNSVYRPKLEAGVVKTLDYADAVEGVIVKNSKPANPQGRKFIWYNIGEKR